MGNWGKILSWIWLMKILKILARGHMTGLPGRFFRTTPIKIGHEDAGSLVPQNKPLYQCIEQLMYVVGLAAICTKSWQENYPEKSKIFESKNKQKCTNERMPIKRSLFKQYKSSNRPEPYFLNVPQIFAPCPLTGYVIGPKTTIRKIKQNVHHSF